MNEIDQTLETSSGKRKSLFRRSREEDLEINEFRVGDITSHDPIYIGRDAAIAGNVSAPMIRVKGIIFGSVTGTTVQISERGQVWGDVFASEILVEVGAKVHGWVSTFDVGTLELIQSGALSANDVFAIHLAAQTDDLSELRKIAGTSSKYELARSENDLFQKLQIESGSDLLSRKELEIVVNQRNEEISAPSEAAEPPYDDREMKSVDGPLWNSINLAEISDELNQAKRDLERKNAKIRQLEKALAEYQRKDEESDIKEQERNQRYPWQDAERYRLLLEERDLYKERFRKLAFWVHNNKDIPKEAQ